MTSYIKSSSKLECVLAVDSIDTFKLLYRSSLKIDILLLDIVLENKSGIKGISKIKKLDENIEIVMLTNYLEHEKVFQSIAAGAVGYLLKTSPFYELEKNIFKLHRDKSSALNPQVARMVLDYFNNKSNVSFSNSKKNELSKTEAKIVNYVIEGLSYAEISKLLDLSYYGVQYHVRNIYKKVNIKSRGGLIKKFMNGDISFS